MKILKCWHWRAGRDLKTSRSRIAETRACVMSHVCVFVDPNIMLAARGPTPIAIVFRDNGVQSDEFSIGSLDVYYEIKGKRDRRRSLSLSYSLEWANVAVDLIISSSNTFIHSYGNMFLIMGRREFMPRAWLFVGEFNTSD